MRTKLLSFIILILLARTFVQITPLPSKPNRTTEMEIGLINSFNITSNEISSDVTKTGPSITIGDGLVSKTWEDVQEKTINSYIDGTIKSAYGSSGVYFLLTHSPSLAWIAMQWDSDNTGYSNIIPMEANDDLWIFGNTPKSFSYGDAYSVDQGSFPEMDEQNDLTWERILVNDTDGNTLFVAWEVFRSFTTDDLAGKDVQFNITSTDMEYPVLFASSSYHKQDNLVTKGSLVFSAFTLGEAPPDFFINNSNPVLLDRFVITQVFLGIITGIISIAVFFYIPAFILNRRNN